ncbi:MAG TPA: hypothetical protein VF026_20965 [Ktedonobacteraceae bacterium]
MTDEYPPIQPPKVEATQPVPASSYDTLYNSYEIPPIPPPPPREPVKVKLGTVIVLVSIVFLLVSGISGLLIAYAIQGGFKPKLLVTPDTSPFVLTTPSGITSTPIPTATATPVPPTPTLVPPTPTPAPYTGPIADDLLKAFIDDPAISVACSADAGCIYSLSNSWWLNCCQYYPAHGSYQFYDYSGGGSGFGTEMIVAVFKNGRNAQADMNGLIGTQAWTAPQYTVIGNCALVTADIYLITDWSYYVATMQQYCH